MTSFTRNWDNTYISQPSDDEEVDLGASRIRNMRLDIKERLQVDHAWAGDSQDGKHNQVTLRTLGSDPTLDADDGCLYIKTVGSIQEIFYEDSSGNVVQLTTAGKIVSSDPIGMIADYAGTSAPIGWLMCYGQEVSRADYANLFIVIATTYGAGDASTTFNVPDLRGRTTFGKDDMGGSAAARLTTAASAVDGLTLGAVGGNEHGQQHTHVISINDPGHIHAASTGDTFAPPWNSAVGAANPGGGLTPTTSSQTGISAMTDTGSGEMTGNSQNVPPAIVLNKIIKY
jgi:microcystin-dependent protein